MDDPRFLQVGEVLRLHRELIDRYGGDSGLRDPGLLVSAVEQPRASFGGTRLHPDIFEMAAAYLFHLVRNHPFVDGNKRVGAASAIVFLDLNGVPLASDEDGLVEVTVAVASGAAGKLEIVEFLRRAAG